MNRLIALLGSLVAVAAVAVAAGVRLDSARAAGPFTVTVIQASPYAFQDSAGNTPANLEVPLGSSVTFVDPTGGGFHDVDFDSLVPTACMGSASVNSTSASLGPWQGLCSFNTAGTYAFHCSIHFFTGQIVVDGGAGATGPSGATGASGAAGPSRGGASGGGGGGTGPAGASGTPAASGAPAPISPATTGASVPASQGSGSGGRHRATIASLAAPAVTHGFAVSASARLAQRGSTLRASLLYRQSQTLGSLTRRHGGPGKVTFTVALASRGRRLLRARQTLSVVLALTVTAPDGTRDTRRRSLKLKA